jgi:hypothetical protein
LKSNTYIAIYKIISLENNLEKKDKTIIISLCNLAKPSNVNLEVCKMKTLCLRLTIVFFILVSLIFITKANAKIDPKLAVGIWLLNEGKGDEAKDLTEFKNNGILKNNPKWVDGKSGKCLEFDGKGSFIEVAKSDSLAISDVITIVGWVHPYTYGQSGKKDPNPASGASVNILSKMESAGSYIGPFWWEYRNNGQVNAYFAASAPAGTYLTPTIQNLPVDKWSHIASNYDISSGVANVYLNGVLAQSATNKGFGALKAGVEFVIGTGKGGADYGKPFDGMIDEVAMFNSFLSQKDIENIMNDGLERALGLAPVSPAGNLSTTWAKIKVY